jgi:PAS domain S-box-containing protein
MTDHSSARPGSPAAGQEPAVVRAQAGRPFVARSWAELIATLHGGLAVVGADSCVSRISQGFVEATGLDPLDVVGRDIRVVFPNLDLDNPRSIVDRAERGQLVGIGQRLRGADARLRWVRVTVVSTPALGDDCVAVVFVQNTTATSHAMTSRRRATLRLTEVEERELQRLSRQLHDGPIQLLVALNWRLSMIEDSGPVRQMRRDIGTAIADLRRVLLQLVPDEEHSAGHTLERWIAPFIEDSPLEMTIEDHLTTPPNHALTQAAFVFVYEMVRATRDAPLHRSQTVSIDSERGGYRIILTTASSGAESVIQGSAAVLYRAMQEYARSLGGTAATELSDEAIRTFSIWLPSNGESNVDDDHDGVALSDAAQPSDAARLNEAVWIRCDRAPPAPELTDASWEDLVRAAPEPSVELGPTGAFLFANRAYEHVEGVTEAELLSGPSAIDRFPADAIATIRTNFTSVRSGKPVLFDWSRENADGERRWVRVSARPRFERNGDFAGALTILEDLSDLFILEELQSSALADLDRTRREFRQANFERLRTPVLGMQAVVEGLEEIERATTANEVLREIRVGLEDAIRNITRSVDLLAVPDLADGDLGRAVRESLKSLLADVELVFVDDLPPPLPPVHAEVLFHIAREAVVNAVIHGNARYVRIALGERGEGISMEVRNDGVSLDLDDLHAEADHMGVRLMIERARAQAGTCTIEPVQDGGTLVRTWLPETPTAEWRPGPM